MHGNKIFLGCVFLFSLILLNSCANQAKTVPGKNVAYYQMQSDIQKGIAADKVSTAKSTYIPSSVRNALIPDVSPQRISDSQTNYDQRRFNVAADKVPAKSFFMGLVEGTPYNVVVNPNINDNISLQLKNVTIEEAMDAVRDVYGYEYRRTSYGYEILPPEIQTQIFNVNYLDVKRTGKSLTELTSGEISQTLGGQSGNPGSTNQSGSTQSGGGGSNTVANYVPTSRVDTSSVMNFWKSLSTTLALMVGNKDGRSVVVNGQAGVVIVHAFPRELHMVARYLDRIQSNMNRQVILEAKILEVQLDDQFQSGIDWNLFGKGLINTPTTQSNVGGMNQIGTNTFPNTDITDFNGMFALNVKGDFGVLIKLLQTQGNVQVLSSPRISTVNNQKAVIKVGQDEFFVTGVSSTTTVSGSATIPTQNVTLTPFFSGITLDVTPQISKAGMVVLHIHPAVSNVKSQTTNITVGQVIGSSSTGASTSVPNNLSLPLALSDIRESDNIVRARNRQIVVIGGLMQNRMLEQTAGTPGLSKIPFLGALFRRTQQVSRKTELVILLRPIIVDKYSKAWTEDLERTDQEFESVRRGFHLGGLPEVFGTEGEKDDADWKGNGDNSVWKG